MATEAPPKDEVRVPPWHSDLPNKTPIDFNVIRYHPTVPLQRIRVLKGELKQTNGGLQRKDLIVVLNRDQTTVIKIKTVRMSEKGKKIYSELKERGNPLVPKPRRS